MTSLRAKILASYGVSKVALLLFAAVVIGDLYYLQNQILEGEAVNTFYVASQEIRRDEKNLFLYRDSAALTRILGQLDEIENALESGKNAFVDITSERERAAIQTLLPSYRQQLEGYFNVADDNRRAVEYEIRQSGQNLLALAKQLSTRERDHLSETARVAAWTLLTALLIVVLLGVGSAFFILRQVVRPIRELERQVDDVAEGKRKEITLPSQATELESFVHHFNDMLKQQKEEQNQARNREKTCALGVLASGVAHELNNPLSNISTSAQLLIEDWDDAPEELCKQWLTHIDEESERARRIVRRLLDSVRQPKLHIREQDTSGLLREAVNLVRRQLPDDVIARVTKAPAHPLFVDRERIQQVFINLIKNAADAGAKEINLSASVTDWQTSQPQSYENLAGDMDDVKQAEKLILIHVEDNGPGISAEHLPQVFDPFFTTRQAGGGTGLGLYLVEEIVAEHKGCIMVDTRPEGGTRFTIWLPYIEEQE